MQSNDVCGVHVVAAVVLIGAGVVPARRTSGSSSASRRSKRSIKVEIKSQGGRMQKDVKQVKLSVDGADVELKKVVLQWDNVPMTPSRISVS